MNIQFNLHVAALIFLSLCWVVLFVILLKDAFCDLQKCKSCGYRIKHHWSCKTKLSEPLDY